MVTRIPVDLFHADREHLRVFHGIDLPDAPDDLIVQVHTQHHFQHGLNRTPMPIPHYHRALDGKQIAESDDDDLVLTA